MNRFSKNKISNLLKLNSIIILLLSIGIVSCSKENIIDKDNNNSATENDSVVTLKVNLFSDSRSYNELNFNEYKVILYMFKKEDSNYLFSSYKEINESNFEISLKTTDYKLYFVAVSKNVNGYDLNIEKNKVLDNNIILNFSDIEDEFSLLRSEVELTYTSENKFEIKGDIDNSISEENSLSPVLKFVNGDINITIKNNITINNGYLFNDIKKIKIELSKTSDGVVLRKQEGLMSNVTNKNYYDLYSASSNRNIIKIYDNLDVDYKVDEEINISCSCLPKFSYSDNNGNNNIEGIGLKITFYTKDDIEISKAQISPKYNGLEIFPSTYSNLTLDGNNFYFDDYSINLDDDQWTGIHGPINN